MRPMASISPVNIEFHQHVIAQAAACAPAPASSARSRGSAAAGTPSPGAGGVTIHCTRSTRPASARAACSVGPPSTSSDTIPRSARCASDRPAGRASRTPRRRRPVRSQLGEVRRPIRQRAGRHHHYDRPRGSVENTRADGRHARRASRRSPASAAGTGTRPARVSSGSSASTVPDPTAMASISARCR